MTFSTASVSVETLTLSHEDAGEDRRLRDEWMATYPFCRGDAGARGYLEQAVAAMIDLRRLRRLRHMLRTDRVRTAFLFFDRGQEDDVYHWKMHFQTNAEVALCYLTRTAAGCRWAISEWLKLERLLADEGTWYGEHVVAAIELQGLPARLDHFQYSEPAYRCWVDCVVANPNPKQAEINQVLDPAHIPRRLRDRNETLWPGDPEASRARLRAIVDCNLARLRALEEHLRVRYEEPARAAAQDMALVLLVKQELPLLRAERVHEQAYHRAVAALEKARKQATKVVPWEPELLENLKSEARNPEHVRSSKSETRFNGDGSRHAARAEGAEPP